MSKKNRDRKAQGSHINGSNTQTAVASEDLSQLRIQLDASRQENEELRNRLQPYSDVLGKAEQDAAELTASILQNEEHLRAEYRRQQDQEVEALRSAAEQEAKTIREEVQRHAITIGKEAEQIANEVRQKAQDSAASIVAEAERALSESKSAVAKQRDALEAEYREQHERATAQIEQDRIKTARSVEQLDERAAQLQRREMEVETLKDDLKFDLEGFSLRREALDKRWNECSPDRLWVAQRELDNEKQKTASLAQSVIELQAENDRYRRETIQSAGRSTASMLSELEDAKSRAQVFADRLSNYPSEEELAALRRDHDELRIVREQRDQLDRQLREQQEVGLRRELNIRELNQAKIQADALRILNDELQSEIRLNAEALAQRTGTFFPELIRIDSERRPIRATTRFAEVDRPLLPQLVTQVQAFAAALTDKQLFYSDFDIRTFIAGLASSQLLILQGLSGTGKTSLPRVFADAITAEHTRIPVQSNWRDRHELLGYYNDFNKKFTETEFTKALYRAGLPTEEDVPWFIVLDEVNLARIEYYFADFLSVLEESDRTKWQVELMSFNPHSTGATGPQYLYQGRTLEVPGNVWFIGTANKDESTFEITDKVYDRAQVVEFRTRHLPGKKAHSVVPARRLGLGDLLTAFDKAKKDPTGRLRDVEEKFLDEIDAFLVRAFDIAFGNRILDQIRDFVPVFVACGGTKSDALDVQIERKILRKLGGILDPTAKPSLEELERVLGQLPVGWRSLRLSLGAIDRLKQKCV